MTRARDVSRLITTPPNIYATDTETSSAGYLTNSSASSTYLTQLSASTTYQGAPNRNLIINGAMNIAQRNTSVSSITTSGYRTADRWALSFAAAQNFGTWTQSVENDGPANSEFTKSLKMLCTTAQASPTSSAGLILYQPIEGINLQGIKKGTSAAQSITLSFWVKSNVTGTYVASLLDENNSIGFPPYGTSIARTYTVSASNTWEKKTLTFSPGTSGVIANNNSIGLRLYFWLGAGSNYQSGTLNSSWASNTPGTEAVGQVNVASAINNFWQVTGVQLETGTVATPFDLVPFDQELNKCRRYFEASWYSQPGSTRTNSEQSVVFSVDGYIMVRCLVPKRTTFGTANITISNGSTANQVRNTNNAGTVNVSFAGNAIASNTRVASLYQFGVFAANNPYDYNFTVDTEL